MRKLALTIVAAATLLIGTMAPASAHWRHHGWGGPGITSGLALGLFAGTLAAAAAPPIYYGVARHGKLPPQRHKGLPPPWIAEERVNEAGTNH